jgi:GntP family gluconate:H+ symporter
MFSGPLLFVALAVGIAFIVVATTRFKMHPFLALLLTAYGMGLCGGLSPSKTVAALTGGFGKTVGYIGIVIACGCIIGMVLEKSGCAIVMANAVLKLIGRTRSVLAMSCTGALVSIPVFCDSGYVILSPLTRSLARQTGVSLASFAVALSMGLYATHCLVPPTPGPIATAGELRADVGTVILLGLLVTLPILAATYAYAQFAGRRIFVNPDPNGRLEGTQEKAAGGPTYGAVAAFGPILFPVLLIALKSISDLPGRPLGDGSVRMVFGLLGDPNTALVLGVFLVWFVVRHHGLETFGTWCGDGLRDAGTIILITAAGGALGGVLRETPMATLIGDGLASLNLGRFSILLPFIVAVGLKTAIGSSTVAMITTASLVSHLLPSMGLATGMGPALATLAIATGAMMVSHVNDSYFWVITQMSGLSVSQGYRLVTVASAIAGLTGMATVFVLSLFLV